MAESDSIPGRAVIRHEAGDTLIRTITLKLAGTGINLNGSTINFIVSDTPGGTAILTAAIGSGLTGTDLANGVVDLFKQTTGILSRDQKYSYRYVVTFPDGQIETFLEDDLLTTLTTKPCKRKPCEIVTDSSTTVTIDGTTITVDLTLRGPQGASSSGNATVATHADLSTATADFVIVTTDETQNKFTTLYIKSGSGYIFLIPIYP